MAFQLTFFEAVFMDFFDFETIAFHLSTKKAHKTEKMFEERLKEKDAIVENQQL